MLPSLGCFSVVECPFFNGGAGQCSRPYCHYRHVKRDPNAPPEPAEDVLGPLPVAQDVKVEDSSNEGPSQEQPLKSRAPIYRAIVEAAPAYNPTPIAILKSSHLPIPYTPTAPTRSSVVKKSKPSLEYVPHCKGPNKPSYPPYCPSSINTVNSQSQSTPLDDPLKNPLYEIYGPEGAQFSPNDVDPLDTGYTYAPSKNASYTPYSPQYVPCSPQYVPCAGGSTPCPQFSPPDSQPSDDDDNVDLAVEAAAQTNGDPECGESLIDVDLSELDNLEFEFEDDEDDDNKCAMDTNENSEQKDENVVTKDNGEVLEYPFSAQNNDSSHHKTEKRRSSGSTSSIESKRHKSSHESSTKSDQKEKRHTSSSSSSKKSSSSRSHEKRSSSQKHSSSKSKSSKSHSSSTTKSGSSSHKKSHSSESKSELSSKHKDKHKDKHKEKDGSKDKHKDKDKHRDREKDKHSSRHKKSSHRSSTSKIDDKNDQTEVDIDQLDEEIRMAEAELDASFEDEDTIEQQCYEMFSEFSETMQTQPVSNNTQDQRVRISEESSSSSLSKKRIAHQASHSLDPPPKPISTVAKKCSPYQAMRDRWEMMKNSKEGLEEKPSLAIAPQNVPRPPPPAPYSATNTTPASLPSSAVGKKKIASVPNVSRYLKPPSQTTVNSSSSSASAGTPPNRFYNQSSQRIDEFGRLVKVRVAHTPNMDAPVMKKPVVNPSDCRKFKVATRQANVNKLYQAYLDAGFGEEAHDMALESERTSSQGTESLGVYSHRIIQILKDLRACAESSQNGPKLDGLSGIPNRVVSHSAMLAGKLGAKVSWSIESSKKDAESKVSSQSVYEQLLPYVLTKEQLEENGFPVASGEKGVAILKHTKYRTVQQPSDPRQRICVRCLKPYSVDKRGNQVKDEECLYHSGRKLTTRRFREAETRYTCCDGTGGYCSVSPCHVFESSSERNVGYMSTISKPWMDADPGVYALDCEMCYTTAGLELTRVTVIKDNLSIAYESLVKPAHKILDYNTKFSGITEEDLKDVTTNIIHVQASLLAMFCDKTILIGHSLESDLKALKLIHPTVVDTSIVFPHKMGPPQKRALRTLAADYLKKIIQSDVGGHDSKEDAVTAMELMLWKLKEDEKTR